MSKSWIEKHRPESFDDIQGNNKSIEKIQEWVEWWRDGGAGKPQLLVGDPGTGKTTTAMVASEELGFPINEINASDSRRSDDIKQFVESMKSTPIDAEHQIVLLDEVDNFHHSGNLKPLSDELRNPSNPIILTANEKWEVPQSIKSASEIHDFKLQVQSRKAKIREIAEKETLDLSKTEIKDLAKRPDLRSAINDLQDYAESDRDRPDFDHRTWSESPFTAIQHLLGGESEEWKECVSPQSEAFDDLQSALLWIDENCSDQFRGLELGVAYDALASADRFVGYGYQENEFRYWKYANAIIECLPETRLSEPYGGYIKANSPNWFKSSQRKPDESSPEASLFRGLKGEMDYGMAGSFFEFRKVMLPLLHEIPREDRLELALQVGLDPDDVSILNLKKEEFANWREIEPPEEGESWTPDSNSASLTDW